MACEQCVVLSTTLTKVVEEYEDLDDAYSSLTREYIRLKEGLGQTEGNAERILLERIDNQAQTIRTLSERNKDLEERMAKAEQALRDWRVANPQAVATEEARTTISG